MRENLSRRSFLRGAALSAGAVALPSGLSATERESKPNIILIMADDMGYGDVGCYGNQTIKTPHIDALARGGMRLTDYHSNGAVCSPTRAALMTGRYQQRCGIGGVVTAKSHRHTGMALSETTFAEVLKSAGYTTAIFGKWHLGYAVEFNPKKQGFDYFHGFVSGNVDYHSHIDQEGYIDWWKGEKLEADEGYSTDLITAYGLRFLEEQKEKPFCLYLPHEAPHYPLQGRKDRPERTPGNPRAFPGSRNNKATYKEMIEVMDEGVGKIVAKVRQLGLERKTFIFFCSDNGATSLGSVGPLRGTKGTVWEGGHRVPAIAHWPGKIEAGSQSDATCIGMDLFPTMAALAGASATPTKPLDGVDLLPILLKGAKAPKRSLFWRHRTQQAMRQGPWKLVTGARLQKGKNAANKQQSLTGPFLFNLDDDLGEEKNLAKTEPKRLKTMLEALAKWDQDVTTGVEQRT